MSSPSFAFSTLACPEWPIDTVIARAAEFGYDGIEWRGGTDGHLNLALSAAERGGIRRRMAAAGLFSLAVTAYTSFVDDDPAGRQANVDELKRYLDLAAEIGAPNVRAFLGELPPGGEPAGYAGRIVQSIEAAVPHAQAAGVTIAVEPHDDFVRSSSVAPILARLPYPPVGAVWDFGNAFAAGEEPDEGWALLGGRIAYIQAKDCLDGWPDRRLTLLGAGRVPIARALGLALAGGYAGTVSLEWERAWHPELPPAEVALPHAIGVLREIASLLPVEKSA